MKRTWISTSTNDALLRSLACAKLLEIRQIIEQIVLEQRVGRIHRLGQKHPIDVYHLITENSIEARIKNAVGAKQALFDELFDGSRDPSPEPARISLPPASQALGQLLGRVPIQVRFITIRNREPGSDVQRPAVASSAGTFAHRGRAA